MAAAPTPSTTRHRQGIEERPGPQGFVPLMHPRLVDRPPEGAQWLHEVKFDGYRMQVQVRGGGRHRKQRALRQVRDLRLGCWVASRARHGPQGDRTIATETGAVFP